MPPPPSTSTRHRIETDFASQIPRRAHRRPAVGGVAALGAILGLLGALASEPAGAAPLEARSATTVSSEDYPTDKRVRLFSPDDPYFFADTPPGFPGQWYLENQTGGTIDANVTGAWGRGITGDGVTIGIVDDGLDHTHPDLDANYSAADSWNFGNDTADPYPVHDNEVAGDTVVGFGDNHGTAVAGIAGARGGDGFGITGAAPRADVAGLRIDFPNQTEQMFADATTHRSTGADPSIDIKNHSYGMPIGYEPETAGVDALIDSHDAGTIHFFAAGNWRIEDLNNFVIDVSETGDFVPGVDPAVNADANKLGTQSARESLTIGALGEDGTYANYSSWGANLVATAPSSSSGEFAITTADRTATGEGYNFDGSSDPFPDFDFTGTFGGTSAAAPLAAGVGALVKQVESDADARYVKHLLAQTSVKVDPGDTPDFDENLGGWVTNAAGVDFNPNYGFGLIDADALTDLAAQWTGVNAPQSETTGLQIVERAIPDNDLDGISETFNLVGQTPLEDIEVYLDISHDWRGDIEALLESPHGTTSRLMYRNEVDSFADIDWTFVTNAFWGELPAGEWTLTVRDVFADFTGDWNSYEVTAHMGVLVPEPGSLALLLLGAATLLARGRRRERAGQGA